MNLSNLIFRTVPRTAPSHARPPPTHGPSHARPTTAHGHEVCGAVDSRASEIKSQLKAQGDVQIAETKLQNEKLDRNHAQMQAFASCTSDEPPEVAELEPEERRAYWDKMRVA